MNVMIVDDEVLTRTNVKYILEAEIPAYTGTTSYMLCGEAGSGAEALEKLPVCRPDIVLSDMRMPGMNGLELCETLHKQYPHIQFIALSNYDDYEYVRGTLQNGAVDYLLKHHLYAKHLIKLVNASAAAVSLFPSSAETIQLRCVVNFCCIFSQAFIQTLKKWTAVFARWSFHWHPLAYFRLPCASMTTDQTACATTT